MSERLAEIEARVEEDDLALATHAHEDIPWLLEQVREAREALWEIRTEASMPNESSTVVGYRHAVDQVWKIARQALADSGEAG